MNFNEAYTHTASSVGLAAKNGDVELLLSLIKSGKPCNLHDNRGWKPIHEASYEGHVECMKVLLGQSDINWRSFEGKTALYLACENSKNNAAALLLSNQANVNIGDNENVTPLHIASQNLNHQLVKLLVENNASIDAEEDMNNQTPLHYALLLAKPFYASDDMMMTVKMLLKYGADPLSGRVSAIGGRVMSPLSFAICHKNIAAVSMLITALRKTDVQNAIDIGDTAGVTPLMLASQYGFHHCIEVLLENNANPKAKSVDGVTAANLALVSGDLQYVMVDLMCCHIEADCFRVLRTCLALSDISDLNQQGYSLERLKLEHGNYRGETVVIPDCVDIFRDVCTLERLDFFTALVDAGLNPSNTVFNFGMVIGISSVFTPLSYLLLRAPDRSELIEKCLKLGCGVEPSHWSVIPPLLCALLHNPIAGDTSSMNQAFNPAMSFTNNSCGQLLFQKLVDRGANLMNERIIRNLILVGSINLNALELYLDYAGEKSASNYFSSLKDKDVSALYSLYCRQNPKPSSNIQEFISILKCLATHSTVVPSLCSWKTWLAQCDTPVDIQQVLWINTFLDKPYKLKLLCIKAIRNRFPLGRRMTDCVNSLNVPQYIADILLYMPVLLR